MKNKPRFLFIDPTPYSFDYKGFFISRLFPSGYYQTYLGEGFGFVTADTLQGIKNEINYFIASEK